MRYVDALNIIREIALTTPLEIETIATNDALGRVCAEAVVSEVVLPPYTNSAVDGFALKSGHAGTYKIAGVLYPGETPKAKTPEGHVWEIMTGAPLPLDCDACAKVEDTVVHTAQGDVVNARTFPANALQVTIKTLEKNENLRFKGTDYDSGTRVASRGEKIRPEHLMALASVGRTQLRVFRKPFVVLVSTGKELVEPGTPLNDGEIYNSTRSFLKSALENLGAHVEIGPTMQDDPLVFDRYLAGLQADLLVTTGAVSMGAADFVRPALEKRGAKVLFHRVDIRPGKPILFAKLNKTIVFGLPGNPVSGVVGTRFFIEPFLKTQTAQRIEKPFQAPLAAGFTKPRDLRCFFKAQLTIDSGQAKIHLLKGQPSYMVRSLLHSSVWAVLREDNDAFKAGDLVDVYLQDSLPYDFSTAEGEFV